MRNLYQLLSERARDFLRTKEEVSCLYSSLVVKQDPLSMGIFPSREDLAFRAFKIARYLSI